MNIEPGSPLPVAAPVPRLRPAATAITVAEARIAVRAVRRGDRTVVTELAGTEPWRPRLLADGGCLARVALVQSRALLLSGDDVELELELGDGCALELVELGATIAHHVRGGPPARLHVLARLGLGARLVWLGAPLIAAAGCHVLRSTRIELAADAAVLFGEALVLGRSGEVPGRARTHTRVTIEGRPVLEETLDTSPAWLAGSPVVLGSADMCESLTLAGVRDDDAPPGSLQAHAPATLWRRLGPARAPCDARPAGRWLALLLCEASRPPQI